MVAVAAPATAGGWPAPGATSGVKSRRPQRPPPRTRTPASKPRYLSSQDAPRPAAATAPRADWLRKSAGLGGRRHRKQPMKSAAGGPWKEPDCPERSAQGTQERGRGGEAQGLGAGLGSGAGPGPQLSDLTLAPPSCLPLAVESILRLRSQFSAEPQRLTCKAGLGPRPV